MGIFSKKEHLSVPSKNIGVAIIDGKINFCVVKFSKKTGQIERACAISSKQEIDPASVSTLSSMFVKLSLPDDEPYGYLIADIEKAPCDVWGSLLSDKTFLMLLKLSIYKRDYYWYDEDHAVKIVEIDAKKTVPLKTLLRYEAKINKEERKHRQKNAGLER